MSADKPAESQRAHGEQEGSRHQLQQIIAELSEGLMMLEPDGSIAYANQAALQAHGVSELSALGGDSQGYQQLFALRYLNNHPVPREKYPLERLLSGEAFADLELELRHHQPQADEDETPHWIHLCRGFLVRDARGKAGFGVLIVQDISDKHEAEKRFEVTFAANPAPAIICRLSDLQYIKVNTGFLEMTGYREDELIGHSVYELDVLEDAEDRPLAVKRLREGRTIPQMEANLRVKDGVKFIIVAGQPLEVAEQACMLFSFIDLDARKKAENALRESEERFSKAFRLAPAPAMIHFLEDGRILSINEAFERLTEYSASEVIGNSSTKLGLWTSQQEREELERDLQEHQGYKGIELELKSKSGTVHNILAAADVVSINDKLCVLSMFQDITARKRSEVELIEAIETVMRDSSWFSRSVVEKLANLRTHTSSGKHSAALSDLTKRELEVLGLMSRGLTNGQIAEELGLVETTVRNYTASIYDKISVHRRADAIIWARERGVVG